MDKLSRKEKISYGLGDMSSNIIFAAISFYLLFYGQRGGVKSWACRTDLYHR